MSRSRRRRNSSGSATGRDLSTPVIRSLAPLPRLATTRRDEWDYGRLREYTDRAHRRALLTAANKEVEDRRTWTPERYRPAKALNRAATRLLPGIPSGPSSQFRIPLLSPVIRFAKAASIPICRRRFIRRQVMHALGLAGRRGVGRGRPRHRNEFSGVSCS